MENNKLVSAFTYLFKHKNWFAKVFVGSLLFFFIKIIELAIKVLNSGDIPHLNPELLAAGNLSQVIMYSLMSIGAIVLCILSIWMSASLCGYFITAIRRYMRGQEDAIPDWDGVMGKLFFRGFKFIIGLFFMSLIGYVFNLLVAHYSVFLLSLNSVYSFMLVVILGIFVCFYVLFMLPALVMVFCEQDKFFSLFNLIRAKQLAVKSLGQYCLTVLKLLLILAICTLSALLLMSAKVGMIILPVLSFYLLIVFGNIIAQYYVEYCKD